MLIVVFATMVLTLALLGSTMDKILIDTVRFDEINAVNQGKFHFQSPDQRQKYIEAQTMIHIQAQGLDKPWYSPNRFGNTLVKLLTLDLGKSHFFTSASGSSSVRDIIMEKLPYTVLLFTSSTIIVSLIGVYTGAFLADKSGSVWERSNSFLAVLTSSFPVWWVGMLMIFVFAFIYPIFPARSTPLTSPSDPFYVLDLLYHMTLPLITIVLMSFTASAYIVKYFVVGILREDFIAAKTAMGLPKKRIVYSHALRNAGPPIITGIVLGLASSFGGSIIIEEVFDWPGMGKLYYDAISTNDLPIIIGLTYFFTLIFVIAVFIADIIYAFLDPRVKIG
ncbi:MAG: ABC transporter permease [Candidatus Nitrosopolaris sp.]|jgi:peptide/nickel transport system permease protein